MLLINRVFISLVSFSLFIIYSAATLSFIHYGTWPKKWQPESWSSYPINTDLWKVIDWFSLPVFLYPIPFITSFIVVVASLSTSKKSKDLWLSCAFLTLTIVLVGNSFNTLEWYFD
jgi:hypothetical protein